ncbi:MAG: NUDIX domain-containing protein, partial [Acidobacteriota bacterium]|nr:NUDIX domain-containing protein [Acidobacteriota bacterium]
SGGWLSRMWEFPSAQGATRSAARRRLAALLERHGLRLQESGPVGRATHTIVRRRLEVEVFRAFPAASSDPAAERPPRRWFSARGLGRAAVSTLTRKIGRASGFLSETG